LVLGDFAVGVGVWVWGVRERRYIHLFFLFLETVKFHFDLIYG